MACLPAQQKSSVKLKATVNQLQLCHRTEKLRYNTTSRFTADYQVLRRQLHYNKLPTNTTFGGNFLSPEGTLLTRDISLHLDSKTT